MIVPTVPEMPRFNPDTDGNPFAWVMKMAQKYRTERMHALLDQRQLRMMIERERDSMVKP